MTCITLLTLSLVSVSAAAALPAAQEAPKVQDLTPNSATECRSGHTICVDLYNGCGAKTGGCYDACSPTTYTIASCSPSPVWIALTTTTEATDSTGSARVFAGVFAESFVIVRGPAENSSWSWLESTSSSAITSITSLDESSSTITSESTLTPFVTTSTSPESAAILDVPSSTAVPELSVIKGVLHSDTKENETDATITATAPVVTPAAMISDVACGKKTKCYDYMTSMNAACPAVRYGGCIDVCKDPKTQFKPKCRAGRAAGKWLFL